MIEKKANTITKTQEAPKSQGAAQKKPKKGVHREGSTPAERTASPGALKMKAIDWDAFAKEAKPTSPKYAWNYAEEANEQHEKLS